jgi:hypothetical protein
MDDRHDQKNCYQQAWLPQFTTAYIYPGGTEITALTQWHNAMMPPARLHGRAQYPGIQVRSMPTSTFIQYPEHHRPKFRF